jgi:hypothetical protein
MLPSSFGDRHLLPRVVRRPHTRYRALAKPGRATDQKEILSFNAQDVVEQYDTDANTCPSAAQADENRQSLPLFYVPRRRAVSPYRPNSERSDLRLQELIYHCMTLLYTSGKLKLKSSRHYRRCNLDSDSCGTKT